MAEVDVLVGGRSYRVACDDGQEAHLKSLAGRIDKAAAGFGPAATQLSEARLLLMSALMVADQLDELEAKIAEAPAPAEPSQTSFFSEDSLREAAGHVEDAATRITALAKGGTAPAAQSGDDVSAIADAPPKADDLKSMSPFQRRALKRAQKLQAAKSD